MVKKEARPARSRVKWGIKRVATRKKTVKAKIVRPARTSYIYNKLTGKKMKK